jgi:hypothetical protein
MTDLSESTSEPHMLRRPSFWVITVVVAIFAASGLASLGSSAGTGALVLAISVAGLVGLSALRAR